jgi:hypothetical protein
VNQTTLRWLRVTRLLPSSPTVRTVAAVQLRRLLVSEQTIEAPPIQAPVVPNRSGGSRGGGLTRGVLQRPAELIRGHPWITGAIALLAISTVVVLWAGARPGYDPYGWLVWGHLTVHFKLDTNGAPSWKPLPFLFTVPFAVVGHYALWLWMITSVAISLSGIVFAWRIAFRLTDAPPERRYAAYAAGATAALALLLIRDYSHFILSAQSDTMIVSLCLAAIDCYLCGRQRWAFVLWVLASLGRPEVWPFLGLHALWAWRKFPSMRRLIVGGLLAIPLLWFGIPALTAKSAFIAGDNALHSPRELHSNKFFGTIDRFFDLQEMPIQLAALLGAVLAFFRRDRFSCRQTLLLAAGTLVWVLVEAAFALHGWPAVPRYLFEAVGVMCVVAGIAVGRVILDLPPLLAGRSPRLSPQLVGWATGLLVLVFAGTMVPAARSRLHVERKDLTHERARAVEINRLSVVVSKLGGASKILACGQPNMPIGYQSQLAWFMGVKIGILYVNPSFLKLHPHPLVSFFPLNNGWKVVPTHLATAADHARCHGLRLTLRR